MRSKRSTTELYSPAVGKLRNNQEHKKQIEEKGHANSKQTQSTKTQTIKQSKQQQQQQQHKTTLAQKQQILHTHAHKKLKIKKWRYRDLNPGLLTCEASALTLSYIPAIFSQFVFPIYNV